MADVGNLRTRISLDSAQFEQSMAGVNRQLRGLKQEQKAVTSSGTGFARGVTELKDKSDVLTRTLKVQDAQVKELKRRYDESREATGENSKETQNANTAYQKAKAEMNKTENALKGITAEIEKQTNPWNVLSTNMEDAGKKMQNIGDGMKDFGKSWSLKVTAPILALGGGALKVGMDFQEGMSKVQAISGATGEDLAKMTGLAKELGAETRFSATEAAAGMEFLAMAGFETNEVMEAMPGLLDLAASSNLDLGRAADIASNIISGLNLEAEETGRVSDVLAKGASTANTNVEQLGAAMETVAPIGQMVGLEIEGLTAGIGRMSDAGIQGQKAGRMLRQGILRLSDPTGEAADLIEELGINVFDADGNMKDLDQVVGELSRGLDNMDAKTQAAALSTIFGSESTAGWSALLTVGEEDLKAYTKELQNSEGAAAEMASVMQDNAKGAITEFKSALEGAGIELAEHMIPVVTNMVEKGTDLVRKFGELDDSTKENIVKMGLFAAAIGPTAVVMGHLVTGVGGFLRTGGKIIGLLGSTGGAGLIGRFGIMGATGGPVLLTVGAIGLLSVAAYNAYSDSKKLHDITTKTADKFMDQANQLEDLVTQYDELELKSRLTNDEFGRMIDIQQELEGTQNPAKVAELKDEYEALREKSGMTNEEIEEMIGLNDSIIEQSPNVEKSFTDKGNAVVDSTDAIHEYIQALKDMALAELIDQREKAMINEEILLGEIKKDKAEINRLDEKQNELIELRDMPLSDVKARIDEINKLMQDGTHTQEEHNKLQEELDLLVQAENGLINDTILGLIEKKEELNKNINKNEEELAKLEEINVAITDNLLAEVDLTFEKGKGLEKLDERIQKYKDERKEIMENATEQELSSGVYKDQLDLIDDSISKHEQVRDRIFEETGYQTEQNKKLDDQNKKLDDAKIRFKKTVDEIKEQGKVQFLFNKRIDEGTGKAKNQNKVLGAAISKDVKVTDNGTAKKITDEAAKGVTKTVTLKTAGAVSLGVLGAYPRYATGTDNHPGGLALVGEEGYELARHGNKWSMLSYGVTDLPRGTEVFTHNESRSILRALNNMPAYARGTNMGAETNRIVNRMNEPSSQTSQPIVLQVHVTSELDGRSVGESVAEVVTEVQDRNKEMRESFA